MPLHVQKEENGVSAMVCNYREELQQKGEATVYRLRVSNS